MLLLMILFRLSAKYKNPIKNIRFHRLAIVFIFISFDSFGSFGRHRVQMSSSLKRFSFVQRQYVAKLSFAIDQSIRSNRWCRPLENRRRFICRNFALLRLQRPQMIFFLFFFFLSSTIQKRNLYRADDSIKFIGSLSSAISIFNIQPNNCFFYLSLPLDRQELAVHSPALCFVSMKTISSIIFLFASFDDERANNTKQNTNVWHRKSANICTAHVSELVYARARNGIVLETTVTHLWTIYYIKNNEKKNRRCRRHSKMFKPKNSGKMCNHGGDTGGFEIHQFFHW